jgi:carbamoyl-phosphate synthase large subunit
MLVSEVADLSGVDPWFLTKIQRLVQLEEKLRSHAQWYRPSEPLHAEAQALLTEAKRKGFPNRHLANLFSIPEDHVTGWIREMRLAPAYKMVDTCAAEFEAATPYFYSCYEAESEA